MAERGGSDSGALERLHRTVDRAAGRLERRHHDRLVCRRGCADCCVDGITVFDVEAERIRRAHPGLLASGRPHAEGRCAFLGEDDACRIYADRPYVCRSQGLPLRWLDETEDGTIVELRDICPLNERDDRPIEQLPANACWTIGPAERRLVELERRWSGEPRRVRLRDLFDKT